MSMVTLLNWVFGPSGVQVRNVPFVQLTIIVTQRVIIENLKDVLFKYSVIAYRNPVRTLR